MHERALSDASSGSASGLMENINRLFDVVEAENAALLKGNLEAVNEAAVGKNAALMEIMRLDPVGGAVVLSEDDRQKIAALQALLKINARRLSRHIAQMSEIIQLILRGREGSEDPGTY